MCVFAEVPSSYLYLSQGILPKANDLNFEGWESFKNTILLSANLSATDGQRFRRIEVPGAVVV